MDRQQASSFQEALEIVDSLPPDQQESLVEIVRHRQIERRREALAASLQEARQEYGRGEVRSGSVADLMADLGE